MRSCESLSSSAVNGYAFANAVYGQLRGYDRLRIRRAASVASRKTPDELAAQAARLFDVRVRDAVNRFPAYAAKLRDAGVEIRPEGTLAPAPAVDAARHCGAGLSRREREEGLIRPEHVPIWTREDQRELYSGLTGPPVPGSFVHSTGGSTGTPLRFYVSRESYEWRTAVSDRGYAWAGAQEGRRSLYVWGTPVYPPSRRKQVKLRLHHRLQGRTYFDSFAFDDEQKRRCCRAIDRVKPRALVGYAGNLVELARFVRDNPDILEWKSPTTVTAAEGLYPGQRELLESTVAREVFMSYGSREFMLIGMECSAHDGYHVSADNLLVEVVDDRGAAVRAGETGRIVITDLRNAANPFIRYEIGDLGAPADPASACPCGLPFPRLLRVDGRVQEAIVRPDGEKMTALFIPHLMKEFSWVGGYQVVQEDSARIRIYVVAARPFGDEDVQPIRAKLQERLGVDMQIEFRNVKQLRKNRSGKTPIVISEIREKPQNNADERG